MSEMEMPTCVTDRLPHEQLVRVALQFLRPQQYPVVTEVEIEKLASQLFTNNRAVRVSQTFGAVHTTEACYAEAREILMREARDPLRVLQNELLWRGFNSDPDHRDNDIEYLALTILQNAKTR